MVEAAVRRSVPVAPGSSWRPGSPRTRFSLRVDLAAAAARAAAAGLPISTVPCRAVSVGNWSALWLGPEEQLLIGPEDAGASMEALVEKTLHGLEFSLVDVSHRQGFVEVQGPHAAEMISTGCPLDLEIRQFPVGSCTRTVFAKTEIVLWRRAAEIFHVEVWRSFTPYLAGLLTQAEAEHQN
jgi:sarcosine oxidase subunit gamma